MMLKTIEAKEIDCYPVDKVSYFWRFFLSLRLSNETVKVFEEKWLSAFWIDFLCRLTTDIFLIRINKKDIFQWLRL